MEAGEAEPGLQRGSVGGGVGGQCWRGGFPEGGRWGRPGSLLAACSDSRVCGQEGLGPSGGHWKLQRKGAFSRTQTSA